MVDEEAIVGALSAALLSRSAVFAQEPSCTNKRAYQCAAENCSRQAYAKGLCNAHYIRQRNGLDMSLPIKNRKSGTTCLICSVPVNGKGGWNLCAKHYRKERRTTIKRMLVELFGAACSVCSGSFPLAVYDFHHTGDKDHSVSLLIANGSVEEIAKEIIKCELLCANCHRMEHNDD